MTDFTITEVRAWEALDSRGRPTVGVALAVRGGGLGRVVVPSGASTGAFEAVEMRDGGTRYGGWGTQRAVRSANTVLREAVLGLDARDQDGLDAILEATDPDALLSSVGSNAVLAVSLGALLAAADQARTPLFDYLGREPLLPMPMVNILSGGAHAGGAVDIQDVLVVPVGATSFAQAIEWADRVRVAAVELMRLRGGPAALVADEGGLADRFGSNDDALAFVTAAIENAHLSPGVEVALAVDIAASQLWVDGSYRLSSEKASLTSADLIERIGQWVRRFPLVSVEDPLHESDWSGWHQIRSALPDIQLLGDDLIATNLQRLERGHVEGAANAVLVKPNQAGTVTRTRAVLQRAQQCGWSTVVSARSGDSEDHWLADLAVGWRAGQIKVGSTMRSERTAKWNRLLELEAAAVGPFAGADVLARPS